MESEPVPVTNPWEVIRDLGVKVFDPRFREPIFVKAEFMECDTCRSKPGTPPLCQGCIRNRGVIEALLQAFPK